MGPLTFKEKIKEKIKHWVYVISLPVYLWSIGMPTLDAYIDELEEQFKRGL